MDQPITNRPIIGDNGFQYYPLKNIDLPNLQMILKRQYLPQAMSRLGTRCKIWSS